MYFRNLTALPTRATVLPWVHFARTALFYFAAYTDSLFRLMDA